MESVFRMETPELTMMANWREKVVSSPGFSLPDTVKKELTVPSDTGLAEMR